MALFGSKIGNKNPNLNKSYFRKCPCLHWDAGNSLKQLKTIKYLTSFQKWVRVRECRKCVTFWGGRSSTQQKDPKSSTAPPTVSALHHKQTTILQTLPTTNHRGSDAPFVDWPAAIERPLPLRCCDSPGQWETGKIAANLRITAMLVTEVEGGGGRMMEDELRGLALAHTGLR